MAFRDVGNCAHTVNIIVAVTVGINLETSYPDYSFSWSFSASPDYNVADKINIRYGYVHVYGTVGGRRTGRGNRSTQINPVPSATSSSTNLTPLDLESNPGRRGGKLGHCRKISHKDI